MSSPTLTVARVDDLAVALLVHRLRQAGGECQQGLAGTGGAQQCDEVDLRVHQCVEGEILLAVACADAHTAWLPWRKSSTSDSTTCRRRPRG